MRAEKMLNLRGLFFVMIAGSVFFSCTQHKIPDYSDVASCVGCHTNYAHLKDVYSPDTVAPAVGCGGEAPYYEPYDRVFLGGEGYKIFKADYGHGNLQCTFCHTGMELHWNGDSTVTHRYAYSELPSCVNCHADLEASNNYHSVHIGDFNCQVCHSQDYNNCGSCHIHGEGARIPAYLDFKIAKNPIPETKDFEFALVRRTLAAPDNWKEYGVDEYLAFDTHPTYNYTTPHNILKITARTDVGEGSCASKCHIRTTADTVYNKELYLFESDLLDWEKGASVHITVDGELPSRWFN